MTNAPVAEPEDRLGTLVHEIKELSPLPAIAMRLLKMAESTNFSAQDLATTISADSALTVTVLRMANSSLFGMPRRISSIREAVVLLGFREVRKLALASCIVEVPVAPSESLDYNQFWRNSLAIGLLAQILAEAEGQDKEVAFTAGVVHNVGRLALAQRRPSEFASLLQMARRLDQPLHKVEKTVLGFSDAELGAAVIREWKFPEPLCEAVANHAAWAGDFSSRRDIDSIVARARRFARAGGLTDSIDSPSLLAPEIDWQDPRVATRLTRSGGFEGILLQVDSLMGHSD